MLPPKEVLAAISVLKSRKSCRAARPPLSQSVGQLENIFDQLNLSVIRDDTILSDIPLGD